jgi:hypothetical protein
VTISRAAPAGGSGARAFAHHEPYRAPVSADPSEGTEPNTSRETPRGTTPGTRASCGYSMPPGGPFPRALRSGVNAAAAGAGDPRCRPADPPYGGSRRQVARTSRGEDASMLAALRSALPSKGGRSPTETIPRRRRKRLPGSEPGISTCRREPSASAEERPGTFGALIGRSLQTV